MRLEEIKVNSLVRGVLPNSAVTIKHVQMFGNEALEVTYVDGEGKASTQLLFWDQESNLELVRQTRPLSFTADGHLFRLASEAQRLSLAFLFDPLIAVNTSSIDPLPHQITAVYETMLNRQPLRFLQAAQEQSGADQRHHRQGHLAGDDHVPEVEAERPAPGASGRFPGGTA